MPTEAAVKERPILFSGPMIRAILAGKKTKTRRVMRVQPPALSAGYQWEVEICGGQATFHAMGELHGGGLEECPSQECHPWDSVSCPYGVPGDRLWVRETWRQYKRDADTYFYRADDGQDDLDVIWKPSIFMPRKACRIKLEVTDVRVERVQDITEEDAIAEGFERGEFVHTPPDELTVEHARRLRQDPPKGRTMHFKYDPVEGFKEIWQELNGPRGYGWDVNPFVWVVSFKRLETKA